MAIPGLLVVLKQRPRQTAVTAGTSRLLSSLAIPLHLSPHAPTSGRGHASLPHPGPLTSGPCCPPLLMPTPDRDQQKVFFSACPSLKEETITFAEKASSLLTQPAFRHLVIFSSLDSSTPDFGELILRLHLFSWNESQIPWAHSVPPAWGCLGHHRNLVFLARPFLQHLTG